MGCTLHTVDGHAPAYLLAWADSEGKAHAPQACAGCGIPTSAMGGNRYQGGYRMCHSNSGHPQINHNEEKQHA